MCALMNCVECPEGDMGGAGTTDLSTFHACSTSPIQP